MNGQSDATGRRNERHPFVILLISALPSSSLHPKRPSRYSDVGQSRIIKNASLNFAYSLPSQNEQRKKRETGTCESKINEENDSSL